MAWFKSGERGSAWGLWLIYYFSRIFGYRAARWFCHFAVTYFCLFSPATRRHLGYFLSRAMGQWTWRDLYQIIFNFAESVLDRVFILSNLTHPLQCEIHHPERIDAIAQQGTGGIMLGSHIGPMEPTRLLGELRGLRIKVLIYSAVSPKLYELLHTVAPDVESSMIQVNANSVDYMFEVKQALDSGQFVAILGDRTFQTGRTRSREFLGHRTEFPTGPYDIALATGAPIILTFAIKRSVTQYDVFIEPFYSGGIVPRPRREEMLDQLMDQYIHRLEYYARSTPHQWYNFFDYWRDDETV